MSRWNIREQVRGLTRWQAVLALLPLSLVGLGGMIGGGIGGAAFGANLSLARRPMAPAARLLAMTSVCAMAFGTFLALDGMVRSALVSSLRSAPRAAGPHRGVPLERFLTANHGGPASISGGHWAYGSDSVMGVRAISRTRSGNRGPAV